MRERQLIERIRNMAGTFRQKAVIRGIGDDCAILRLPARHELLVTTDLCIENVHFRRSWHPAESTGHKCLARGLSDIAAMGGEPLACFLSLGLPKESPAGWITGFFRGLNALARRFQVQLSGGDLSAAPEIVADIILLGAVPRGRAVLRSGARPGDCIYVTGALGHSAAVLQQLFAGKRVKATKASSHFYPQPRLEVGRWLRQRRLATAMIDLSDGLSVDLAHICKESGVSARIDAAKVPVAKSAGLELALHGGEDYELLFTAPPRAKVPAWIAGVPVTRIGSIRNPANYSSAIQILGENGKVQPLRKGGWEHFQKSRNRGT
jgi:thiamine-monophosphate kinase